MSVDSSIARGGAWNQSEESVMTLPKPQGVWEPIRRVSVDSAIATAGKQSEVSDASAKATGGLGNNHKSVR